MIFLKKTRLKLKKSAWLALGGILGIIILIIIGINVFKTIKYHQTNEYKLLEAGYTKDEINILNDYLEEDEITSLTNSQKDEFLLELLQDNYFIKNNLNRYTTYHSENETLTAREVVATVNTNTDYTYYDYDIDTDTKKDYLMLVNKYYHLNSDYSPSDFNVDNFSFSNNDEDFTDLNKLGNVGRSINKSINYTNTYKSTWVAGKKINNFVNSMLTDYIDVKAVNIWSR